jgi:dolichyl-phosphate-mannose-protein mannosyltransferase
MEEKVRQIASRWRPELIGLIIAAIATRMWALFSPNSVVFDEVYFKVFAAHYMDGRYYFDIHPPLGKLLLAGWARIIGLNSNAMINGTAVGIRVLPAVAGILLIPLMWGILRRLGASRPFAFLGAGMVLFDNAILVESRFILMDSMLLLFGLAAVYFYLVAQKQNSRQRWAWLCLAAISAGAAVSVKWTGLNALAIILLIWLWDQRSLPFSWKHRIGELCLLIIIPAILYISVFWIHFSLLPHSGDGDAFMSAQFQSTLVGNPYYSPTAHLSFWSKFVQLNVEMYHASETLTATHPYGSKWYSWPLEVRPIYYWEGAELANGDQGNIYLLGNPIIWWGIWASIILGAAYVWLTKRKLRPATIGAMSIAGVAYLINYLPFIGITRVMFLYHYFFAFLYSIIFAVMLWNDLATDVHGKQLTSHRHRQLYIGLILITIISFCFFAPISYGTPLSPAGLQLRMWLHSWR